MSKKVFMRVEPAATGEAEAVLTLDSDITAPGWGGYSTQQLDADIAEMRAARVQRMKVRINSGGGEVQEAMAMYDTLKALKDVEVVAEIRGYCCSAATLVALACSRVEMTPSSSFMVHEPKGGCYGTLADWEAGMVHFRQMRDRVLQIYAEKTGKPVDDVEQQMKATSWLTAAQALEGGWIDAISGAAEGLPASSEGGKEEGGDSESGAVGAGEDAPDAGRSESAAQAQESSGLLGLRRLKSLLRGGKPLGATTQQEPEMTEAQMRAEMRAQQGAAEQARADLAVERSLREEMVSREVARRLAAGGGMRGALPRAHQGSEGAPIQSAAEGWLARMQSV